MFLVSVTILRTINDVLPTFHDTADTMPATNPKLLSKSVSHELSSVVAAGENVVENVLIELCINIIALSKAL